MNSSGISEINFSQIIRLVREIGALVIIGVIIIGLFTGDLRFDFTKLSASELVSILLAFFSIALSAAFYFAATSQSNQFYDNVNNFTKDTSTLLGRLDEQVKGIGGRQSELKDSLDKYYFGSSKEKLSEDQKTTKAQVQQVEQNLAGIVSELFDKARLDPAEREEYERRIKDRDDELRKLRERLGSLGVRSDRVVRNYTRNKIKEIGIDRALELDPGELLLMVAAKGIEPYRRDLATLGYTTTEKPGSIGDVTEKGSLMVAAELEAVIGTGTSP